MTQEATEIERIDTVLVALDLEAGSDAVLARATQLASAHTAWLTVLHVIEADLLSDATAHMEVDESELRERLRRQTIATIESLIVKSRRTRRTNVQVEFGSSH